MKIVLKRRPRNPSEDSETEIQIESTRNPVVELSATEAVKLYQKHKIQAIANAHKVCDELMDKVRAGIPGLTVFEAAQVFAVIAEKLASLEAVGVAMEASPVDRAEELCLRGVAVKTIDATVLGDESVPRPSGPVCRA